MMERLPVASDCNRLALRILKTSSLDPSIKHALINLETALCLHMLSSFALCAFANISNFLMYAVQCFRSATVSGYIPAAAVVATAACTVVSAAGCISGSDFASVSVIAP